MSTQTSVDQIYLLYDRPLLQFLRESPIRTANGLPLVVMASPQRAFATMSRMLVKDGKVLSAEAEPRRVPLPAFSVSRSGPRYDLERNRGVAAIYPPIESTDGKAKRLLAPDPYTWTYQVECWSTTREVQNLWTVWLRSRMLANELFITSDFTDVEPAWGRKLIPLVLESMDDTSDLEPGEEQDRRMRMTAVFRCDGWLVRDTVWADVVQNVRINLLDGRTNPGTQLGSFTAP